VTAGAGEQGAKLRLREEGLDWTQIDEDIVILDGRDAVYLTLNGSGVLLWRMLAASATRDELVRGLVGAYDVEKGRALTDTDAFLHDLCARGLLVT
jgi:Coenzyme PQQ synthesis protein D (PqqD)